MRLCVCIKQVPDTGDIKLDPRNHTVIRENMRAVINPFDTYAIEEAILLRERFGGTITALSMGPRQAKRVLEEAAAMGTDKVILLSDRKFAGSDTLATSYVLYSAVNKCGGFDIILCGKQATDGDTAQVGPELAERLGIPHISYARKITSQDGAVFTIEKETETGCDIVSVKMPFLVTVVKDINTPRGISILDKIRAKRTGVTVWTSEDIGCDEKLTGLEGSPTRVVNVEVPEQRQRCKPQPADDATIRALANNIKNYISSIRSGEPA